MPEAKLILGFMVVCAAGPGKARSYMEFFLLSFTAAGEFLPGESL